MNGAAAKLPALRGVTTISTRLALSVARHSYGGPVRSPAHKIILGGCAVQHAGSTLVGESLALPAGVVHRVHAPLGRWGVVAHLDARRYSFEDAERLARAWRKFVPNQDDPLELFNDALKRPVRRLDARLARAVEVLETGASVALCAQRMRLSESRLTHLFSEQLGTPPRSWHSWLMLRNAMAGIVSGQGIARTAHTFGFADAAHLWRTFRGSLGVTPSTMAAMRTQFVDERLNVFDYDTVQAMSLANYAGAGGEASRAGRQGDSSGRLLTPRP